MMQWFVAADGQPTGPMTEAAVRQLAAEARILPDTLVWAEGMTGWQAASVQPWWPAPAQPAQAWSAPQSPPPPAPAQPAAAWPARAQPSAPTGPWSGGVAPAAVPGHAPTYAPGVPGSIQVLEKPAVSVEHFLVPMNRSALSVAAGYLGLFSITLLLAPVAAAVSILALADLRRRPHLLGRGRAIFGLVTGSLGTLGLIAMLIA